MRPFWTSVFVLLLTLQLAITAASQTANAAAIPNLIRYGGVLKDADGVVISSVTTGVTFAIFTQQSGGAAIWKEKQNVTTDSTGSYSVLLGSMSATGVPVELFAGREQRWLGVQADGQSEDARVLLVSVPYAFKSHDAETLNGMHASDFVLAHPLTSAADGAATPVISGISSSALIGLSAGQQGPTDFVGATGDQVVSITQDGSGSALVATAGNAAVIANSTASGGPTVGVSGTVASSSGTAGRFNNTAGGMILSGATRNAEQFFVDGEGNVNTWHGSYMMAGKPALRITAPGTQGSSLYVGVEVGTNSNGKNNVFTGYMVGRNNSGSLNSFYGSYAGRDNTAGKENVFVGHQAGSDNTTTSENTFIGAFAGWQNRTGARNTYLGSNAGERHTSDSDNINIATSGPDGESHAIRIGNSGNGDGQQNATYIAGIFGTTVSDGVPVFVNSNGQLGVQTSSLRFKQQVRDMGDKTSALMKLRPVTFLYKPEYDGGDETLQYGLIAEEVAKVYPELVTYDTAGKPFTVRYQFLASMLLNEVQKQCREIEDLQQQLATQNAALQERIDRLQSTVMEQLRSASNTGLAEASAAR